MSYDPNCTTESRVLVNGVRLPAADVDVHIRKEGSLDIGRYAEASFASPFRGEDFLQHFGTATPDEQDSPDSLRIDLHDSVTERWVPVFHGIVTGVGNNESGNRKIWNVRAQGPGLFLNKIYIGQQYGKVDIGKVLKDLRDELEPRLPFPVEIRGQEEKPVQEFVVGEDIYDRQKYPQRAQSAFYASFTADSIDTRKTFTANKHTLSHVVNWVRDKVGIRVWLEPTTKGVTFVATDEPTTRSHTAHTLGGEVEIISNDALSELNPVNTITIHGKPAKSLMEVGEWEVNSSIDTFTKVKARHPDLYRRAGNTEFTVGPVVSSKAEEKSEIINEAKSMLKKKIDGATGGNMQCLLAAPVVPFDTIEAQPTCNEQAATGTDPITYEVARVRHKIRTNDTSTTALNIGVHTSLKDIEIVDSWVKDA